jgi:hypothetical protein
VELWRVLEVVREFDEESTIGRTYMEALVKVGEGIVAVEES